MIDDPLEGAALPVNEPYLIKFRGISDTGIEQFEVSIPEAGFNMVVVGPFQIGSGSGAGTRFFGEATWTPNSVGDFTIRVRARNQYQLYTAYAEVHVTVGEYIAALVTAVLTPDVMGVGPSPTPTMALWHVLALMDVNCRVGPGTDYEVAKFVLEGETVEVVGRNQDGTWLELAEALGERPCWAYAMAFKLDFDAEALPIHPAPPLPTGSEATGCLITNPSTGMTECISPCPASASGPACSP